MKVLPYADPGRPDTRSPIRLLVWVGSKQLGTLGLGVAFGIAWMLSQALLPYVLGRAVDDGLADGRSQPASPLGRRAPRARQASRLSPA